MLPPESGAAVLAIARSAIAGALDHSQNQIVGGTPAWLHQPGACFVTLMKHGDLRGCIGSLEAKRSLIEDIRSNAMAAAFHDPRFPPLTAPELDQTNIEVSVLSSAEPLVFGSEIEALAQLRPGIDGVVFEFGTRRSTFLPQVWEQLPEADLFLAHLKEKAGFSRNFWADGVRLSRYTVNKWKEPPKATA